jgi:hypothetical protein
MLKKERRYLRLPKSKSINNHTKNLIPNKIADNHSVECPGRHAEYGHYGTAIFLLLEHIYRTAITEKNLQ